MDHQISSIIGTSNAHTSLLLIYLVSWMITKLGTYLMAWPYYDHNLYYYSYAGHPPHSLSKLAKLSVNCSISFIMQSYSRKGKGEGEEEGRRKENQTETVSVELFYSH